MICFIIVISSQRSETTKEKMSKRTQHKTSLPGYPTVIHGETVAGLGFWCSLHNSSALDQRFPDSRGVTENHPGDWGTGSIAMKHAVIEANGDADAAFAPVMGFGGESARPRDVAMAGGVRAVAAFAEDPFRAGKSFAEGKIVGGDVLFVSGETLFRDRKLVHEGEAKVVLFGSEVDGQKTPGELFGGFPTNLAAQSGFIPGRLDAGQVLEEKVEDRFEKVPIFSA